MNGEPFFDFWRGVNSKAVFLKKKILKNTFSNGGPFFDF